MNARSIIRIALITILILLVPLVAMQLTDEVKWSPFDFIVMGVLLFAAGAGIELALKKLVNPVYRLVACAAIAIVFLAVWAELAVGVFGTPLAGS